MRVTREENGLQGKSLIGEERESKWADDSAEMMKGDAAQDQRALEAPRAGGNKESIVEMVQWLTNEIDKDMATLIWESEPSTQLTTPDKKQSRDVKQRQTPLDFLSAKNAEQINENMPQSIITSYKEGERRMTDRAVNEWDESIEEVMR